MHRMHLQQPVFCLRGCFFGGFYEAITFEGISSGFILEYRNRIKQLHPYMSKQTPNTEMITAKGIISFIFQNPIQQFLILHLAGGNRQANTYNLL